MRWLHTESILKGVFLGLMLYGAALQGGITTDKYQWDTLAKVNLPVLAGVAVALVLAAAAKLREGFRFKTGILSFFLFLLLESPFLMYAGVLAGAVGGLYWLYSIHPQGFDELFAPTVGAGAAVGILFGVLREVRHRIQRLAYCLVMAAGMTAGVFVWTGMFGSFGYEHPIANDWAFAAQVLAAVPLFALLALAGREEESEVEIGAVCACLSVVAGKLVWDPNSALYLNEHLRYIVFLVPLALYLVCVFRLLPWLRVRKHAFRGLSYASVGRHLRALQSFRRALQHDPDNRLARDGFWQVHRSLDLNQLANDPQLLALVDLDLCLSRAGGLLVQGTPTPAQLEEANRLLDLVVSLRPALRPSVDYWHAVMYTHARRIDEAAATLERLLDPAHYSRDNKQRQASLLPAWQLALVLHDELRRRVGEPQLAQPGRRMEAIAAVERRLAEDAEDPAARNLKPVLYRDLTEPEYFELMGDTPPPPGDAPPAFDYGYVQQLGLALIGDDVRWQRGGEFLRMAAHGMPTLGPSLFLQIAQAQQRVGKQEEARHNFELAKRAGRSIGPKNLADAERQAYFAVVKFLGETCLAAGDLDAAIENFHLYAESERSGLETLRVLADLHERKGDPLSALRVTEQALLYNPKDRDLLDRKDRYYYSVLPEQLQERLESVRAGFDFDYCLRRTKSILDGRMTDPEWLNVAAHLSQLALVVQPDNLTAKVLQARVSLRYGEREQAVAQLEKVRAPKPEAFANGTDEEAWYTSCQLLGDLYMEMGKPDLAVACYSDYRQSAKSGARTLFKLGQAYELLGDRAKAARCYKQVTAYDGNPLAPDASRALSRLQSS